MLPPGHLAGGALLGAWRSRRGGGSLPVLIAGGAAAANVPDLDLLIPGLLDRLGIAHRLRSGVHHGWVTHTPLFWVLVSAGARRLSRRRDAPAWAPEAARTLGFGVAVHLVQDSLANTVSLLWPLRRSEYGLGLDRLAGVTDHAEYVRRYPASPAGRLELGLVFAALVVCARSGSASKPNRLARNSRCSA
jgi:hypothetical protein